VREWIGFGCLIRHDIHPYFLLVQLTRPIVQSLNTILEQIGQLEVPDDGLDNITLSASSSIHMDSMSKAVFVIPTVDWKLIGKEAAQRMWRNTPTIIRVSEDHAEYMKLSSVCADSCVFFEIGANELEFELCIKLDEAFDAPAIIYAPITLQSSWIIEWGDNGVGGYNGQSISEAVQHPGTPPIVDEPQASPTEATESVNPPLPPQPPTQVVEVEEEEEEVACYECSVEFPISQLVNDLCNICGTTCETCNEFVARSNMSTDMRVCMGCSVCCVDCHYYFHPDSVVAGICPSCRREFYTECRICHTLVSLDEDISGVCPDCVVECDFCGDRFSPNDINSDGFCFPCASELVKCVVCLKFEHNSDMVDGACLNCTVVCQHCGETNAPSNLNVDGICGECMVYTACCSECGTRLDMTELNDSLICANCRAQLVEQIVAEPATKRRRRR
jgi:hypothetical protein